MNKSILSVGYEDVLYCEEIRKCKSLKRIKCVLHYYEFIQTENKEEDDEANLSKQISEFLINNEYEKNLISDYHHMLSFHLTQNDDEYAYINTIISKLITCKISNCKFYLRNQRDREQEVVKKSSKIDHKHMFYMDILDNIHTFFVHGYDIGFRTKLNYSLQHDEDQDETKDNLIDSELYHDEQMMNLREHLTEKRRNLESVRGENRMKHNKFSTELTKNIKMNNATLKSQFVTKTNIFKDSDNSDNTQQQHQSNQGLSFLDLLYDKLHQKRMQKSQLNSFHTFIVNNEYDSDAIYYDILNCDINESIIGNYFKSKNLHSLYQIVATKSANYIVDDKQEKTRKNNKKQATFYSFGARYYYWEWYKNNSNLDSVYNPGYRYNDWYIHKQFSNLKEEILQKLNIYEFTAAKTKCINLLESSATLREMRSRINTDAYDGVLHYNIKQNEPLSYKNILSVVLYTDYSELCFAFSSTWRKRFAEETNEQMKKRNGFFWNWAKLLTETVHLYGYRLNYYNWENPEPQINTLYHGVSHMYFASFISRFSSPTSMTRQIAVAAMFADNGIILDIQQFGGYCGNHPLYFNCTFVSAFMSEDERLFIGGAGFCGSWSVGSIPDGGLLQLSTIRVPKTDENYVFYVRALSLLHTIINGEEVDDWKKQIGSSKKKEYLYFNIIKTLILKTKIRDKMPNYIIKCFDKMIDMTLKVTIDLYYISNNYTLFREIFKFSEVENCANLISFDNICDLFPVCVEIVVNMEGQMYENITQIFINELINILKEMKNKYMLKKIMLTKYKYCNDINFNIISKLFDEQRDINNEFEWKVNQQIKANNIPFLYIYKGSLENSTKTSEQKQNESVTVTKEDVFNITKSEKEQLEKIKQAKKQIKNNKQGKILADKLTVSNKNEEIEDDISNTVITNKTLFINVELEQLLLANNDFRLYNGHPLQTSKGNYYGLAEFALIPYDKEKNYVNIFHVKKKRFVIGINDHVNHEFYSSFKDINGVPIICGNKYKYNDDIDECAIWEQIESNEYEEKCYSFRNVKSNRYITATKERAPNGYLGYKVIGVTEEYKSTGSLWTLYQFVDKKPREKFSDGRD